ncbi:unnamed protein product [Citrullus colocynthis]|uniref:HMG box domain-containing protein n=1 Tax=Citrullus colocynthis TaxID=252529 RepID=A0ABP0YQX8_9ROSI
MNVYVVSNFLTWNITCGHIQQGQEWHSKPVRVWAERCQLKTDGEHNGAGRRAMAKAKKPQKSPSAYGHDSSEASQGDTGLCVKRSEEMKRAAKASRFNTDNKRTKTIEKPKSKQKKKNDKFDVNKPKKPPTAFFYFLDDFRKEFQKQNPDVKMMRDVGKACGEKWKTMTYEEKVQYYDIATEKRAEFDKAMAEYKKRKESGIDQESEEDWEIDG